jgi:hypothetical protein
VGVPILTGSVLVERAEEWSWVPCSIGLDAWFSDVSFGAFHELSARRLAPFSEKGRDTCSVVLCRKCTSKEGGRPREAPSPGTSDQILHEVDDPEPYILKWWCLGEEARPKCHESHSNPILISGRTSLEACLSSFLYLNNDWPTCSMPRIHPLLQARRKKA